VQLMRNLSGASIVWLSTSVQGNGTSFRLVRITSKVGRDRMSYSSLPLVIEVEDNLKDTGVELAELTGIQGWRNGGVVDYTTRPLDNRARFGQCGVEHA